MRDLSGAVSASAFLSVSTTGFILAVEPRVDLRIFSSDCRFVIRSMSAAERSLRLAP